MHFKCGIWEATPCGHSPCGHPHKISMKAHRLPPQQIAQNLSCLAGSWWHRAERPPIQSINHREQAHPCTKHRYFQPSLLQHALIGSLCFSALVVVTTAENPTRQHSASQSHTYTERIRVIRIKNKNKVPKGNQHLSF